MSQIATMNLLFQQINIIAVGSEKQFLLYVCIRKPKITKPYSNLSTFKIDLNLQKCKDLFFQYAFETRAVERKILIGEIDKENTPKIHMYAHMRNK